jgi:AcrR family transcriptional regulator
MAVRQAAMTTRKKRAGYAPARKNDPEGVRTRFLDVAAELFQSRGYCATGMQAIFEEAGVTAGAFYHHFEGKKDLALAVIEERVAAEVEQTWIAPVREAKTTLEGVTAVFRNIATHLEARRAVRGCPLNNLTLELAFADPEFQERLARVFANWQSEIEAKLKHDMNEQRLPRSKPGPLAAYIIAVYSGAMALCKVQQSAAPLLQCLPELRDRLSS